MQGSRARFNIFLARTKLQILIATEIAKIRSPHLRTKNYLIIITADTDNTDISQEINSWPGGILTTFTVSKYNESSPSLESNARLARYLIMCRLTGGLVYHACIDNYVLGLFIRALCPFSLCTYDEGAFNIKPTSSYYSVLPLPGPGLKRSVLRAIFPSGVQLWCRQHSKVHYTIFPRHANIVDGTKLAPINISWIKYSTYTPYHSSPYRELQNLKILIGASYQDFTNCAEMIQTALDLDQDIELYIPHPRCLERIYQNKTFVPRCPVESFLLSLPQQSIIVYHFSSTIEYILSDCDRIKLINLSVSARLN